jgi:exopolysaccharide biosynthesis polyprenyl glycosylphosphotransferase
VTTDRNLSAVVSSPQAGDEQAPQRPARHSEPSRRWLVRLALASSDLLALVASVGLVWLAIDDTAQIPPMLAVIPVWFTLSGFYGLYQRDRVGADNATLDEIWPIFHCITVASWIVFVATQVLPLPNLHGGHLAAFWLMSVVAVPTFRSVVRIGMRRRATLKQNAVVVGAGLVGQEIARKIMRQPSYGLELVGFVDANPLPLHHELADVPVLGSTDELADILDQHSVEHVVLAFTADHEAGLDVVRVCNELGVQVDIVPRLFEVVGSRAAVYSLEGTPLLGLTPPVLGLSHRIAKRTMDVIGATIGLAMLSPAFLVAAIAIKANSRGPIFFRQTRIGKGQKPFTIVKFRTMVEDAEARKAEVAHLNAHRDLGDGRMFKIPDDPRVTSVGKFLRKTSMDEFPQLWNVLRGEMSLVGPRPLIPHEHQFVNDWGLRRLDLTPGLTGLWQVCGRSEVTFSQMLVLDYLYVTNWSLWGDCKLIMRTVPALLGKTRGAA